MYPQSRKENWTNGFIPKFKQKKAKLFPKVLLRKLLKCDEHIPDKNEGEEENKKEIQVVFGFCVYIFYLNRKRISERMKTDSPLTTPPLVKQFTI